MLSVNSKNAGGKYLLKGLSPEQPSRLQI